MQLQEVREDEKNKYNNFVADSSSGSFLQSWEWGQWQERLGRKVERFFIVDDDKNTVGSTQVIFMPLSLGKFYVYAPYGPVIMGASENLIDPSTPRVHSSVGMEQGVIKEIKKKFSDAVFIRIEPKAGLQQSADSLKLLKSPNIQPGKTLIIDLTKPDEQLLSEMHHKTRYNIKLAQKHGVEVQDEFGLTVGKGLFTKEALELIYQTSKRQGYMAQGRNYFSGLVDFLAVQNSQSDLKLHIYKALYQKQLLATAIILDFGKTRTYLFGGSAETNKNIMAPYLLHWQAMLDAKALDFESYDFWGIETSAGEQPGFVRFKLGFAPQPGSGSSSGERQYPGAYDVIQNQLQYRLYKSMRALNKLRQKISR